MTITYVGVGAAAHGDNASVVPALPAGITAGDVLVLVASIRNTAAFVNSVTAPGGWTLLGNFGDHVRVYGQVWDGAFAAPTVGFVGGAAGDTTSAQLAAVRGASLAASASATLTNASAQNIAYPALTPDRDGSLVLAIGWKQDDWTSVATLAGMTEIAEASTTTGNDQGLVWDYVIQTTAATVSAGSFVVTGGAGAVSKGITMALNSLPLVTVTEQDVYPPRVLVSVTELTIGDAVEVYRSVGGTRTLVRAGSDESVADPSFLVVDAELPFGVPVSYIAVVNGVEVATAAVTYTLPGGKVAVSDAISGDAVEVVIWTWPTKRYTPQASVFRVGGRNLVVSGDLGQYSTSLELYVETDTARDNLLALLATTTEGVFQVRQPGGYNGVDTYYSFTGIDDVRMSVDQADERHLITVEVVEVEAWAPTLEARGFTYADLDAAYAGLTYADLAGDYATYLALAQADLS